MREEAGTHQAEDDPRNATPTLWPNGRLVPRAEAVVSIYDSGFLLGDGVWEGLRLHRGVWAFLGEHLDWLFEGARVLDLDVGMDRAEIAAALGAVARANATTGDAHAPLMVTRGPKVRPLQHPSLSRSGPIIPPCVERGSRGGFPRRLDRGSAWGAGGGSSWRRRPGFAGTTRRTG